MQLAKSRARRHAGRRRKSRPSHGAAAPDLLRRALDALPAHVCVLDGLGTVLWVNRAWRQFSASNNGSDAATGEGSNYLAVCSSATSTPPDETPSFAAQLRDVLAGRLTHFEIEYPCHSPAELRWFVASAALIEGPGPGRVVVSHQSVTARRLADARARERERMESLGALAGGIAHDFNNVLGAVLGHAELLLQAASAGSAEREPLQRIQRAALRGRDLVRRVLAFGRRAVAEAEPLALAPLVEETMALLSTSRPPGVRQALQLAPGADALWVRGNATDLQQALMNLVQNAWLALQGQPGEVAVSLRLAEEGCAELQVADSGCGVPTALRQRIFEPFFTTRAIGEGTGLGLAQVRSTVTRMGGRIDVHSGVSAGSAFTITLPLVVAPAEPATLGPARKAVASAPAATLLLVDDDEVVGLAHEALLERAGHRVQRATSARDALRELERDGAGFGALVSDHAMPEMSGLELCRAARALRPSLPLLIVTGYISDALKGDAAALGATLLPKEEAFERLEATVSELLQHEAAPRSAVEDSQDKRDTPCSAQA
jgi:signal transduction histidine kinase/CheY-like chemotaxis protein